MIAPQFSLRQILALMTVLGVFFLIASLAIRGQAWAAAIVVAGLTVLLAFMLYGLCFFAAWCVSLMVGRIGDKPARQSPFAHDTPAPQIIPPEPPA